MGVSQYLAVTKHQQNYKVENYSFLNENMKWKIHKCYNAQITIHTKYTEMISAYVDHNAKKHVKNLDINLEDTAHCLREIDGMNVKGPQPVGTIPVTWDIIGLYPNVPHEGGLEALEEVVEGDDELEPGQDEYMVRLMEAVLTFNSFEFDGKLYCQKDGCAIGTRAAPTYAGIFMGRPLKLSLIHI